MARSSHATLALFPESVPHEFWLKSRGPGRVGTPSGNSQPTTIVELRDRNPELVKRRVLRRLARSFIKLLAQIGSGQRTYPRSEDPPLSLVTRETTEPMSVTGPAWWCTDRIPRDGLMALRSSTTDMPQSA